jgi:ABC-2 type transport system ATP-binding protein
VEICGEDALAHPSRVRAKFGLVPQEIALYPTLTARENLRYFGALYGLWGSRLSERVERCLHWVEMEEHADRRVETYSGGMKRRINFAAALLHEPRLLFLDEPTVGIDAHSRRAILDRLLELRRSGVTLIYTTHYMEEAQKLCDRLAVIDRGRIVAEGTPSDLLARHPGCADLESLLLKLTAHGEELR